MPLFPANCAKLKETDLLLDILSPCMHCCRIDTTLMLLIALLAWATVAACSDDVTSTSSFVAQLNIPAAAESRIRSMLNDTDVDRITSLDRQSRASLACNVANIALYSGYISQNASAYQDAVELNWSSTCWLEPRCIAQPKSTDEVSRLMRIVTFFDTKFAIRSGGHNPNPGWAGVDTHGILIDMSRLTAIRLSDDGSVASVAPGNRWGTVFATLNSMGKTVNTARLNWVGVGGYMLGGGLTYFNSLYGLAADNVVNYEVVLANSSVINANASSNPDLWWALKGTNTNFGVITRYDIAAVDNASCWFEALEYAPSQAGALLEAIVSYASAAEKDHNAAITFALTPTSGFVEFIYHEPTVRPAAYSMFYDIPSEGVAINSTIGSMADLNNAISTLNPDTAARRMIASVAHRFDLPTLKDLYAMYLDFDASVKRIQGATGFVVQPFTRAGVQHGNSRGGNPVGLVDTLQNHLTYSVQWADSANDGEALAAIRGFTDRVEELLKKRGLFLRTKMMNDAGDAQNVLGSYGEENLKRLKDVSARYDPLGVFQKLQNNGFLLSKA
ncbi:FAD-dependent monooxygenase [Apiospora arundinis]|uniref:FAD-dependent monooxygenase n=1 Tax=Apiospora arundinis TaxID=335852 RepID=A0ABR2JNT6_9PEZI